MGNAVPRGLYAITDSSLTGSGQLIRAVARAVQGGTVMLQYRDKSSEQERRRFEVQDLVTLCRPLNVPVIVNDDVDLAAEAGAAGVHLGQEDCRCDVARQTLGGDAIIGVSCYDDLSRAVAAEAEGASYIAFGSFFPSATKPNAVKAEIELLREAKRRLSIPVVAIGGITPENGAALVEAGADLLAVIQGLFGQPDIESAASAYSNLFPHR